MLSALRIDSFLRIARAEITLGPGAYAFIGRMEQGKSSLLEAIRFVLRGVNPRVKLKGEYTKLVHNGRRSGSAEIMLDGMTLRRNVRDGKLTGQLSNSLNVHHVDIQLGAREFCDIEGEQLRTMFVEILNIGRDTAFVTKRFTELSVPEDVQKDVMPLIQSSGFQSAEKHAEQRRLSLEGEWRGITQEAYGNVKALSWKPQIMFEIEPSEEQIAKERETLQQLESKVRRDRASLSAAQETLKIRSTLVNQISLDDARQAVDIAAASLVDVTQQMEVARLSYAKATEAQAEKVRQAAHAVEEAKRAAATLQCPCCREPLNVVMQDGVALLKKSIPADQRNANISTALAVLEMQKAQMATVQSEQGTGMAAFKVRKDAVKVEAMNANNALQGAMTMQNLPQVPEGEVERLTKEIADYEPLIEPQRQQVQMLEGKRLKMAQGRRDVDRAIAVHYRAMAYRIVQEACGQSSAGIPAELIARTTRPVNEAMAVIAQWWEEQPFVLSSDMQIVRADGMEYALLSQSAKWRGNVQMQLALAHLSQLKVVAIDGFDVLEPAARPVFFDMLSKFQAAHPDSTVIVAGTMTSSPPAWDGMTVKFFKVDQGSVEAL